MDGFIINPKYYCVAENLFSVFAPSLNDWAEDPFTLMDNYELFKVDSSEVSIANGSAPVFTLELLRGAPVDYTEEVRQDEEGQKIICGYTAESKPVFDFCLCNVAVGMLVCSSDYKNAQLLIPENISKSQMRFSINNALMVLYAIATAPFHTLLFHAAVVDFQGYGYMFLGKSGTGKSTHARLWLKHCGAELLNDDNPVVRFDESGAVVYGSPWSGKTPCYRNVKLPLGGLVFLSQAPYNKIKRLRGVEAYASILTSVSGKRWDVRIADGLHHTENALAMNVPVWHLECLPDEAAAHLCCQNVAESRR